jgi:hypothetical protein
MDFVKLLRSFEEFLYEVMAWLLFYPRTLWRVIRQPLAMMRYSDQEQHDKEERQYDDAISPPLFMMISIVIAHLLEMAVHHNGTLRDGIRGIFQTDQTFFLLRCVVYSLYPLIFAGALVRRRGVVLDRDSLRAPFFAQCYVTAPATLVWGVAAIGLRMQNLAVVLVSGATLLGVVVWFLSVQTRWFQERTEMPLSRAFGLVLGLYLMATVISVAVGTVLVA